MPFEKFEASKALATTGRSSNSTATANLAKNGRINFNKKASQDVVKDNTHVIVYYDKANNQIALEFIKKEDPDAFKLIPNAKTGVFSINANKFFKSEAIKINTEEFAGSYDLTTIKEDKKEYIGFTLKSNKNKIAV